MSDEPKKLAAEADRVMRHREKKTLHLATQSADGLIVSAELVLSELDATVKFARAHPHFDGYVADAASDFEELATWNDKARSQQGDS